MTPIEPIDGTKRIRPVKRVPRPVDRDPSDQEPPQRQEPRERKPPEPERPASGGLVDVRI